MLLFGAIGSVRLYVSTKISQSTLIWRAVYLMDTQKTADAIVGSCCRKYFRLKLFDTMALCFDYCFESFISFTFTLISVRYLIFNFTRIFSLKIHRYFPWFALIKKYKYLKYRKTKISKSNYIRISQDIDFIHIYAIYTWYAYTVGHIKQSTAELIYGFSILVLFSNSEILLIL